MNKKLNPLLDTNFLYELDQNHAHEIYIKIIALNFKEYPVEEIEGQVLSGSINIDGQSSVRRSCQLSMITNKININEFYWGIKSKFKLYIGIKNEINKNYEDIIWFNQGMFVINDFNISKSLNNNTISLSGKDKMCLLNGDLGGQIGAVTDFGKIEEYNSKNNVTTITQIKIKNIIKEMIHAYGNELWHNIIIQDIPENGIELLDYINKEPLYVFIDPKNNESVQVVLQSFSNPITVIRQRDNKEFLLDSEELKEDFDPRIENGGLLEGQANATTFLTKEGNGPYTIAKIERGMTAGYRLTELTYPGELVANIGDSVTSILDKIVKMLGPFEYFYDEDGHFIFQRQPTYIGAPWSNIITTEDQRYIENAINNKSISYTFDNNTLITALTNRPNLSNLKNDYIIWGKKKTASGAEVPVHLRYAIDIKPKKYVTLGSMQEPSKTYYSLDYKSENPNEIIDERWDWRELIYQMALDYRKHNHDASFLTDIAKKNPDFFPFGYTGYEQYYTDMEGFWRTLYIPKKEQSQLINDALDIFLNKLNLLKNTDGYDYQLYDNQENLIESSKNNQYPAKEFCKFNKWIKKNNSETNTTYQTIENNYFNGKINQYEQDYHNKLIDLFDITFGTSLKKEFEKIPKKNIISTLSYSTRFRRFKTLFYKCGKDDLLQCKLIYLYNNNYILPKTSEIISNDLLDSCLKDEKNIYKDIIFPLIVDKKILELSSVKDLTKETLNSILNWNDFFKNKNKQNTYFKSKEDLIRHRDNATKDISKDYLKTKSNLLNSCETKIIQLWNEYEQKIDEVDSFTLVLDEQDNQGIWTNKIQTMPESLLFWIDFLESYQTEPYEINKKYKLEQQKDLDKYSIKNLGVRTLTINDDKIKGICFKTTPNILFISEMDSILDYPKDEYEGHTFIHISNKDNLFTISSQGKSAKDVLNEQLYYHLQYSDSISLTSIPIYYLKPNSRISVYDKDNNIAGDYIINKMTIPLAYNGTMSISAFKAPDRLL